jgi:hypothetical protein
VGVKSGVRRKRAVSSRGPESYQLQRTLSPDAGRRGHVLAEPLGRVHETQLRQPLARAIETTPLYFLGARRDTFPAPFLGMSVDGCGNRSRARRREMRCPSCRHDEPRRAPSSALGRRHSCHTAQVSRVIPVIRRGPGDGRSGAVAASVTSLPLSRKDDFS